MKEVREATRMHTRLLKCALEVEDSRAYWLHADGTEPVTAHQAFDAYWFGARSLNRVGVLLTNMRARYDEFPAALMALHRWPDMSPDTRRLICHWHLQLADPLYRRFAGDWLVSRRADGRDTVTRDLVVGWVGEEGADRWAMATRMKFASKLLSAAFAAGLVGSNRDPRPLVLPRVDDDALEYAMYLLREVTFEGSLLDNPYLTSVGLEGPVLEDQLRGLPGLTFKRQGDLVDFGWRYPTLTAWADANLAQHERRLAGGAR